MGIRGSFHSCRHADRAPPGGNSEQQQAGRHGSYTGGNWERHENSKSQEKGKDEKTTSQRYFDCQKICELLLQ